MEERRVVITGLGVVAPNGIGKEEFWQANILGKSAVDLITSFDTSNLSSKIAAMVNIDPFKYLPTSLIPKLDRFAILGLIGSKLAIEDSKINLEVENKQRIGVSIGSGLGGILFHEEQIATMYERGFKKAEPLGVPKVAPNAISGHASILFSLTGPNIAISTACSSGTHGIGWAYDIIRLDRADIMLAGGAEAPITPYTFSAFNALRVLSKLNDLPQEASRPFDKERDGFVMGEGAGVLILEELQHALKRNANIYSEIIGYSSNSGAYHMVMPLAGGRDATKVMELTLKEANIRPKEVDYINAHGTSTQANDKAETQAIKELFNEYAYKIPISSTKSMIGHTIGAAGAIEAIVCALVIEHNLIPPTINYKYPDPDCDLDYVPNYPRAAKVEIALSNSFGFGSNNASIVIKKYRG